MVKKPSPGSAEKSFRWPLLLFFIIIFFFLFLFFFKDSCRLGKFQWSNNSSEQTTSRIVANIAILWLHRNFMDILLRIGLSIKVLRTLLYGKKTYKLRLPVLISFLSVRGSLKGPFCVVPIHSRFTPSLPLGIAIFITLLFCCKSGGRHPTRHNDFSDTSLRYLSDSFYMHVISRPRHFEICVISLWRLGDSPGTPNVLGETDANDICR